MPLYRKFTGLLFVVLFSAFALAEYQYCQDSDNGMVYDVKGNLVFSLEETPEPGAKSFYDYCYSSSGRGMHVSSCSGDNCYLIEYSCLGSEGYYSIASKKIDCDAEGYNSCDDGKCVVDSAERCEDGTVEGSCSLTKPYYCDGGLLGQHCLECGCPDGKECDASGICRIPIGSCTDGIKNRDESDTDCGGSCFPCRIGKRCSQDRDCYEGNCRDGFCKENDQEEQSDDIETGREGQDYQEAEVGRNNDLTEEKCAGAGLRAAEYGNGRCCEGLDLIGGICTTQKQEAADACSSGCLDDAGNCIPVGLRTTGKFCDIDRALKEQLSGGTSCSNSFECTSNICADGECTKLGLMQSIANFFQRLLGMEEGSFFNKLFGRGNTNEGPEVGDSMPDENLQPAEETPPAPEPSFNALDNLVELEVNGITGDSFHAVLISGPAIEIERIPGFSGDKPNDNPGRFTVLPIVFETDDADNQQSLSQHLQNFNHGIDDKRSISINVKNLAERHIFTWNIYENRLTSIEPGLEGRMRYTYTPDNNFMWNGERPLLLAREPKDFPIEISKNPETDSRVDIEGLFVAYPAVEVNESVRTITLTYDYIEGGPIWSWVEGIAKGTQSKKQVSVYQEDPTIPMENGQGWMTSVVHYYEAFPIKYEQFTGYSQAEKVKERIILAYGWSVTG